MWLSRGTEVPGGHRVQLERTAAALRSLGVEVQEHLGTDLPPGSWDVVHGFQLDPDDMVAARARSRAVAISTIYVGLNYTTSGIRDGRADLRAFLGRGWRGLRYLTASLQGREQLTRLAMREMTAELAQLKELWAARVVPPQAATATVPAASR